jgi:hypothetical protein
MSIRMPTRHRTATDSHSAYAAPCLESAPRSLKVGCSLLLHSAGPLSDQSTPVTAIRFRAQSAASAQRKQQSIPITLPR